MLNISAESKPWCSQSYPIANKPESELAYLALLSSWLTLSINQVSWINNFDKERNADNDGHMEVESGPFDKTKSSFAQISCIVLSEANHILVP